jgi:hypothetical protein
MEKTETESKITKNLIEAYCKELAEKIFVCTLRPGETHEADKSEAIEYATNRIFNVFTNQQKKQE